MIWKRGLLALVVSFLLLGTAGADQVARFAGDRDIMTYHRISCRQTKLIPADKRLFFKEPIEAVSSGFVPCSACRPRRPAPVKNTGFHRVSTPELTSSPGAPGGQQVIMRTQEQEIQIKISKRLKVPGLATRKGREILGGCRVRLDVKKQWAPTGLRTQRGQLLEITAKGMIATGKPIADDEPPGPWFPDGRNSQGRFSHPLDAHRMFHLRGRIGRKEFRIGKHLRYIVSTGGELQLGIKDADGSYADNVGHFDVLVVVRPISLEKDAGKKEPQPTNSTPGLTRPKTEKEDGAKRGADDGEKTNQQPPTGEKK